MAALISLQQAKDHLRITDDTNDGDLSLKVDQASAVIVGRCGSTAYWAPIAAAWTQATVPPEVQSAILVLLTHLHEHRGDDMTADTVMWQAVDRLIALKKDPVLV